MLTTMEIEPGIILDELVSACDDTAFRLQAAAGSVAHCGGRALASSLVALAEQCEEQSLSLMALRIPFVSRRLEGMYERGVSTLSACAGNRLALLCVCLEAQARLIEAYSRVTQMDLPASWAIVVARHLDALLEARSELKALTEKLPAQHTFVSNAETRH